MKTFENILVALAIATIFGFMIWPLFSQREERILERNMKAQYELLEMQGVSKNEIIKALDYHGRPDLLVKIIKGNND